MVFLLVIGGFCVPLLKDYYIDGQNTELIFFEKITTEALL